MSPLPRRPRRGRVSGLTSPRVLCIGEALIDLIAAPGDDLLSADRFAIREGGAPMNVAVALARLGVPSGFIGVVGDDPFGHRLRDLLEREGVDSSSLKLARTAATSLALAWQDAQGDGHFQLLRMADATLAPADVNDASVRNAAALVTGSVALATEPSGAAIRHAVEIASAIGVLVVVDVNMRPAIWPDRETFLEAIRPILAVASIAKLSLDDARFLISSGDPEVVFERMANLTDAEIVITDGKRGAYRRLRATGAIAHDPVFEVTAVDPTGAGDAFTAALVSQLVTTGWASPSREDMRFAMAAGALATTTQGALASLPGRDDIVRFLAERDLVS